MTPPDDRRHRRQLIASVVAFVLLAILLGLIWPWLIR